jgi:hypothetical protein
MGTQLDLLHGEARSLDGMNRLSALGIFILTASLTIFIGAIALARQPIIVLGVMGLAVCLASWRLYPRSTALKNAGSLGFFSGLIAILVLWRFGLLL